MKSLISSIIYLMPSMAVLSEIKYYNYNTDIIVVSKSKGIEINESCANNKASCLAKKLLTQKFAISNLNLQGGKNPGSVACEDFMNGKIKVLENTISGGKASYCFFNDGSYLFCKNTNSKLLK